MNSGNEDKVKQSTIFLEKFSDVYYNDNKNIRNFFSDYILSLFSKKDLILFDIAEWGIGGGHNLHILSYYANSVHGYDGSVDAINDFKSSYINKNNSDLFFSSVVNLCKPFATPIKYDMIIYGFFPYVLTDNELIETKKNLMASIKDNGYVVIFDFLSRREKSNSYRDDSTVKTYKRNINYWIDYLDEFDLIDFRLFDSKKGLDDRLKDSFTIDTDISSNDDFWTFIAVFRKR